MRYHTCIAVTGNAVARFAGDLFSTAPGWVQACVMRVLVGSVYQRQRKRLWCQSAS